MLGKILPIMLISISFAFAQMRSYDGSCCGWYHDILSGDGACCHWHKDSSGKLPYDIIVVDSNSAISKNEFMIGNESKLSELRFLLKKIHFQHMYSNPDLEGTITIRLTINHNGSVINDKILSSTTKNRKFDEDIKNAIRKCEWRKINSGTTTVTIPITFWKSKAGF